MISIFSVITGVLWLNIALVIIFFLRKRTALIAYYSPQVLILIACLALIRILVPLDLKQAYVVNSYYLLPGIRDFLNQNVLGSVALWHFLVALWGFGSVIVLFQETRILNENRKIRNNFQIIFSEQAVRIASEMGFAPEHVLVSPNITTPMVGGFFSHKVYLPNFDISDEDLRWILRHEQQHIKSKDSWLKLFYLVLRIVFWWNPIIYYFQSELDTILELRCDQVVLVDCNEIEKVAYSEALLHTAQQLCKNTTQCSTDVVTFIRTCNNNILTNRIKLILNGKTKHPAVNFVIGVLCFTVFVTSYLVLFQTAGHAPTVENEVIISTANSYLVHTTDDLYTLYFNETPVATYTEDQVASRPLCDLKIVKNDS